MIGFLITQEVVKSKGAGKGFRRFKLGPKEIPFKVTAFHDFVKVHPFDAGNKAGLILAEKGKETTYPLPYYVWKRKAGIKVLDSSLSLSDAMHLLERKELVAKPSNAKDPRSAWQTATTQQGGILEKIKGNGEYRARCGVSVDPYGVFLVESSGITKSGVVLVSNAPELGDAEIPKLAVQGIEDTYLYPCVRGKDVKRWYARPIFGAIIINESTKRADIPSESTIRKSAPKTYAFLYQLREQALRREKYWRYFSKQQSFDTPLPSERQGKDQRYFRLRSQPTDGRYLYDVSDAPFFALFNVGPYSFAPFKVVWQMGANRMNAACISSYSFSFPAGSTPLKIVIPCTGTTSYSSFETEREAHYVCALLNSSPVGALLESFSSGGRGFGAPSILSNIAIPRFNAKSEIAVALAKLSVQAHKAAASKDEEKVSSIEKQINTQAALLWGITSKELETV